MPSTSAVIADREQQGDCLTKVADEFEGPDDRIPWRASPLEWPIRRGFIDFVARKVHTG